MGTVVDLASTAVPIVRVRPARPYSACGLSNNTWLIQQYYTGQPGHQPQMLDKHKPVTYNKIKFHPRRTSFDKGVNALYGNVPAYSRSLNEKAMYEHCTMS